MDPTHPAGANLDPANVGKNPMYRIETGVPMPTRRVIAPKKSHLQNTLEKLEVDQSFAAKKMTDSLRSRIWQIGKASNRKFSIRQVDGGFRVWRKS